MQTERLMTYEDLLALANQLAQTITEPVLNELKEVKQKLQGIEDYQKKLKKLVLTNAKEIGEYIGVSEWQARDLMKRPDFPKPMTKRTGKYNCGKWKAEEVERYFRINKSKI